MKASKPRRFECREGGSSKFWEIAVDGKDHIVRFGPLGAEGQTKTKPFSTPGAAAADAEKLVASKLGKGYVEVGAATPGDKTAAAAPTEKETAAPPQQSAAAPSAFVVEAIHPSVPSPPVLAHDPAGVLLGWASLSEGAQLLRHGSTGWTAETPLPHACATLDLAVAEDGTLQLACDQGGRHDGVHGFTYAEDGIRLEVARRESGKWSSEVVAKDIGQWCYSVSRSWKLATRGDHVAVAWVAMVSREKRGIFLAERKNGRWQVETVVADTDSHQVALALDASGQPHLVCWDNDFHLRYGVRRRGAWHHETIGERYDGNYPSIAIDSKGGIHVAYMGHLRTADRLVYGYRAPEGAWSTEMIDKKGNNGFRACLALDADDRPHIVYGTQTSRHNASQEAHLPATLRYAVRDGAWQIDTVAEEAGWAHDLVLGPGGDPWIAFRTDMKKGISLAHKSKKKLGPAPTSVAKPSEKELAKDLKREQFRAKRDARLKALREKGVLYLEQWSSEDKKEFWEIKLDGSAVTQRSGKVGHEGRRTEKRLASSEKALELATNLIHDHSITLLGKSWHEDPADAARELEERTGQRAAMLKAVQEEETRESAAAATAPDQPRIWDLRDDEGPLLGRLRGVVARNELRSGTLIFAKPGNAHFALRRPLPTRLPDVLTNAEHLLVVSARARKVLETTAPELEYWPVRLVDGSGKDVSTPEPYFVALVLEDERCVESDTEFSPDGYFYLAFKNARYAKCRAPAPIFRARNTFLIVAKSETAAAIEKSGLEGVRFVPIAGYEGEGWTCPPTSYQALHVGTEGAEIAFAPELPCDEEVARGQSVATVFPKSATVKMQPPKSRSRVVDIMSAGPVMLVSERVKAFLEKEGVEGVEYYSVSLKDHSGKACKEKMWAAHVVATCPYVDLEESCLERKFGNDIRSVHDLVVDESLLPTKPPGIFRLAEARYPHLLLRNDLVAKLQELKVQGFRATPCGQYAYAHDNVPHLI